MTRGLTALALTVLAAGAAPAAGADNPDLKQLQAEIASLRAAYDARIAELEARLQEAERKAEHASATPAGAAPAATPPTPSARAQAVAGGFNPEVSLILQGQYRRMKDVDEREITGFAAAGHDHGAPRRGFSLDHSELVISANVDPTFRGLATFALIDGEVEVEEAWFQTIGLGQGVGLKGGRFLSGIGYLNEQHAHQWDFADAPLMYTALFGEHANYGNDGVQLKWVAPTELFLELGAEVGRGARFPGTDRNTNGVGASALFAHLGGDVGVSHSWRAGVSWLNTRAKDREQHFEDLEGEELDGAFSGRSRTWMADVVWKWAPEGNPRQTNLTLQAEYFQRRERGRLGCVEEDCGDFVESGYRTRQSGWYAQAVYQFMPRWRAGLRYDRLDSGRIDYGANNANLEIPDYRPTRTSLMFDYSPSEFSRLRLQLSRDRSMQGVTDNQLWLQYIMSLGAHGAHSF